MIHGSASLIENINNSAIQMTQASSHGGGSPQIQNYKENKRNLYKKKNKLGMMKLHNDRTSPGTMTKSQEVT